LHYRDERYITASFKSFWVSKPFGCWKKVARKKGIAVGTGNIASIFSLLLALAAAATPAPTPALAAGPSTRPAPPSLINPARDHDSLVDDLQSGDDARVTAALQSIRAYIKRHGDPHSETQSLQILIDAKRYADLESIATGLILKNAAYTPSVAALEKLRAQSFLGAGDTAQALAAAKGYYNVATLTQTADAIDLVSLCLAAAHPDDPAIVERFKQQQVAWATAAPTSQPTAGAAPSADLATTDPATASTATASTATDDLGAPILPSIPTDSKPFDAAIAAVALTDYGLFVGKGNLLLLAGRASEARKVFEQAVPIAPAKNAGQATENVARAIRAQAGCVAPANAYILASQAAKGDAK
jgi:hypothetical protein